MKDSTKRTMWLALRRVLTLKAFWRLLATIAVLYGLTVPEGLFELIGEVVREFVAEAMANTVAAVLTAPLALWASL